MYRARIAAPDDIEGEAQRVTLDTYALRLLAEGDSWFSYGSIPAHNMLTELQFDESSVVLNLASPGENLRMIRRICDYGAEFGSWLTLRSTYRFDAILLSAGGNDLIAALPHLLRSDIELPAIDPARPDRVVDQKALRLLERYVVESITGIVNLRDKPNSANADVPLFAHTYDYPTPADNPARGPLGMRIGGPWLYPLLMQRLPIDAWVPVIRYLIDRLADTLLALPARLANLHVVDTRQTLIPAVLGSTRASTDWENEIHPTRQGYRKLAAHLSAAVQRHVD